MKISSRVLLIADYVAGKDILNSVKEFGPQSDSHCILAPQLLSVSLQNASPIPVPECCGNE